MECEECGHDVVKYECRNYGVKLCNLCVIDHCESCMEEIPVE